MHLRKSKSVVIILAFTLPFAAACKSSDDDASSSSGGDKATTTLAPTSDQNADSGSDSSDPTDDSTTNDGVGNPGSETLVDGPITAENTVTWTADGSWDKDSLTVSIGEVFTFVAGEGASTAAVTFNGNDSYTITTGLTESFTLAEPGTYTVSEYVSGTEMTVTVDK